MDQGKKQEIKNWFWYVYITIITSFFIAQGTHYTVEGYWYFGMVFWLMAVASILAFTLMFILDNKIRGSGTDGKQHS